MVEVRRKMKPLFEFPYDETEAKKQVWKQRFLKYNEILKAKKSVAVAEAQKTYAVFHCFFVGNSRTQWDRIVNKMHTKNPWIGMNGKSNKGICMKFWISWIASSSTSSPSSLLTQLKSSITTCSR